MKIVNDKNDINIDNTIDKDNNNINNNNSSSCSNNN